MCTVGGYLRMYPTSDICKQLRQALLWARLLHVAAVQILARLTLYG
jgi:hypothetical protein